MALQSHTYFRTVLILHELNSRYYAILVALSSNPNLFRSLYTCTNISKHIFNSIECSMRVIISVGFSTLGN